jgi:predicted ferric reductase
MLFQKFNELYPDYQTVSPRALSVYMSEDDDSDDICYYDSLRNDNKVNDLMNLTLNDVENKIIANILNGSSKLKYDSKLYGCSASEFNKAVENIKTKMSLIGIEEN